MGDQPSNPPPIPDPKDKESYKAKYLKYKKKYLYAKKQLKQQNSNNQKK